jgi:hypothetical protein
MAMIDAAAREVARVIISLHHGSDELPDDEPP